MKKKEEKTANVVAMEEKKEPTYEQLKNWCDQLMMQRNQLAERLNNITDVVNKLPWLFKAVEHKNAFPSKFIESCVQEIVLIMTPPEEEQKDAEEEPKK